MKRAIRRHHRERLKNNRKNYYDALEEEGRWSNNWSANKASSFWVNTPTPCSCWMCGNPRKFFKQKTLQELKAEEKELKNVN